MLNKSKYFIILPLLSVLTACGGSGQNGFQAASGTTGKFKTVTDADTNTRVESPYTISGSQAAFEALVKKIGSNNDSGLANALAEVVITPLDAKDLKTENSPNFLIVEMKFKKTAAIAPDFLKFKAPMVSQGQGLSSVVKTDKNYQLSVFCYTKSCHRIELRLQRKLADGSLGSEIGVLVSKSRPTLKIIKPSSIAQYSDRGLKQIESLSTRGYVEQNSVVIVAGSSYAELVVKANLAQANPTLKLIADLIDTENAVTEVTSVALEGGQAARAKLVGNDSNTGDLMFELISGREAAILIFEKNQSEIEQDEPGQNSTSSAQRDLSARARANTGLFPTSAQNRSGLSQANDFASYGPHPRTHEYVKYFRKHDPRGIKNVFSYTHNVSPYIAKIFENLNLSPEFAYLMPVESSYLKGNGTFNAQQVTEMPATRKNPDPNAYGPWQILNNTAFDIRNLTGIDFNIIKVVKKKADPQDDRGFLVQSTFMAASYIKKLVQLFPHDTGMAVMAYHAGAYGVCREVAEKCTPKNMLEKLRNLAHRNVSLEQVEKFKMIHHDHRDYAFKFLSWREMGQNQSRYGLDKIQKINSDAYKKRLSRPNGPSPL
jgi:hypothetical protein